MINTEDYQHSLYKKKLEAIQKNAEELPAVVIIHELKNLTVEYMSPLGLKLLGISFDEIKGMQGKDYHNKFFNVQDAADYLPKILKVIDAGDENEIITYFQQARRSEFHEWKWYLSTSKIFMKDEHGRPTHVITTSCPVDPAHHINAKVNRLLEENNFLRKNHELFSSLTKREKEMLKFMALGKNSTEIAAIFHISEKTAVTHRRNIRSKLNAQTNYDLVCYAQAFDLI
ncbi:MAG: response regulator containing a CheY-like receiver domain and an DNA-binding domain [Cytophagaceae bacterium]|jgi:DNA-binding CsgD family transcriptional regulator|nr:response regulator containing a CheY-like receiver domain and an DNA-binding domain [Cytophagaceae bacterium]